MSDVKDILGLDNNLKLSEIKEKQKFRFLKSRNTKNLVAGLDIPSIVATQKNTFKNKNKPAVRWKYEKIVSSARDTTENEANDVELFHWVKFHNVSDYRFGKFCKKIKFLEYTDVEYDNYLSNSDWTKSETNKLFDLCKRFDLRFIIIEDKYNPPEVKEREYKGSFAGQTIAHRFRSVEELKNRFYEIQCQLTMVRKTPNYEKSPYFTQKYDIGHEQARKIQLEKLFKRTKDTDRQMAELALENRANEHAIKQLKKEQKDLRTQMKTRQLGGLNSAVVSQQKMSQPTPLRTVKPAKPPVIMKPIREKPFKMQDLPKDIIPVDLFYEKPNGIFLRSQQPLSKLNISDEMNQILNKILESLQIDVKKPLTISTSTTCHFYDKLRYFCILKAKFDQYLANKRKELESLRQSNPLQNVTVLEQKQPQNLVSIAPNFNDDRSKRQKIM